MEVENRYITFKQYAVGYPSESDFEIRSLQLPLKVRNGSKDVIVKNIYVSIDPYQINRLKEHSPSQKASAFAARLEPGQVIDAFGVGRVVVSDREEFQKDDLVAGLLSWADYSVVRPGYMLSKVDTLEFPLSYHLGVLGPSGFTAFVGLHEVCKAKAADKVFVSAAAGSVGNLVGQFAKLLGCHVVGCAGSKQKVDILKDKLEFDDAFNYKEEQDLKAAVKRYFPDGIDVYFDNVGGDMLEAAVDNMNSFSRIAVCGVISEYTDKEKGAAPDMTNVIYKRISIRGFLAYDHSSMYDDFLATTYDHLRHGRINVIEDISQGLENVTLAFAGLFRGDNVGKKIVQLADV